MKSDCATAVRQHLFARGHCSSAAIAFEHLERINRGAALAREWSDQLFLGEGAIAEDGCIPGMDKQVAGLNTLMLGLTPANAP